MIKKCLWRGKPVSCAAVFKMQPTDRGMCCSFNKEKADKMFRESRYREHVMRMNKQDETMSKEDSKLPEWLANPFYLFCLQSLLTKFITKPQPIVKQAGILGTAKVAKRISQTSPSGEQTSPSEEGGREHALPKTGCQDICFATCQQSHHVCFLHKIGLTLLQKLANNGAWTCYWMLTLIWLLLHQ